MDVDLTEEQEFFAQTTRKFLAAQASIAAVRALETSADGFERAFWKAGCDLGWTSMLVPEADGGGTLSGAGRGMLDLVCVAEEFGRAVAPGPLVPTNVVAYALAVGGTDDQRARWLPGILSGDVIGAWVAHNGDAVEAGAQADVFVVGTPDVPRLIAADSPGVVIGPRSGLDLVRRFATVTVPEGAGEPLNLTTDPLLQVALALQCAETCGVIERVFDMTLEYLDHRYSFGRPLSSYQALKHRVADDKMNLEACHAITTAAAYAIADDAANASELALAAKAFIGAVATEIVQDCVQLHGGIAVTWEHDIHLYLRRATVNRATFATPSEAREAIATMIVGAA
ncbi:MAG TPA: acyl-CoA dehydrogenase family protein [Acidimicrobiales bacterium]|nr:acyl-CoA dehydrogenase family protein [Acidimicrobiales bacterium]